MTVSLGELLFPVVEVSGLAGEEDNEERSFKEQYGQEGAPLNIAGCYLWSVNIWEQCEQSILLNSICHFSCYSVEMHYHPQKQYP